MKKWKVTYDDGDDISSVWVYAETAEEAEAKVMEEYWDCRRVIDCYVIG